MSPRAFDPVSAIGWSGQAPTGPATTRRQGTEKVPEACSTSDYLAACRKFNRRIPSLPEWANVTSPQPGKICVAPARIISSRESPSCATRLPIASAPVPPPPEVPFSPPRHPSPCRAGCRSPALPSGRASQSYRPSRRRASACPGRGRGSPAARRSSPSSAGSSRRFWYLAELRSDLVIGKRWIGTVETYSR